MTDSYALAVDIGGTFTDVVVRDSRGRTWVEQKRLRPGSGGDGRSKGGDGQVISFRVRTSKPWLLNATPRRIDHAAEGLDGGESGLTGRFLVNGKACEKPRRSRCNRTTSFSWKRRAEGVTEKYEREDDGGDWSHRAQEPGDVRLRRDGDR